MGRVRAAIREVPRAGDGVVTNLTVTEMDEVLEAISAQRVTWDGSKRIVHDELAQGEFDYNGRRYALQEEFEVLTSLWRLSA